jgi:hypothetical protein
MFVVDRSALAVLLPLALLIGAVLWSNHSERSAIAETSAPTQHQRSAGTVAANLPSS